jgi:hypothetical protein
VSKVDVSPHLNLCYNTGHEFASEFAPSFSSEFECTFDPFDNWHRNRSTSSGNRNRRKCAEGFDLDLPELLV